MHRYISNSDVYASVLERDIWITADSLIRLEDALMCIAEFNIQCDRSEEGNNKRYSIVQCVLWQ